jgi:hypothetical protein
MSLFERYAEFDETMEDYQKYRGKCKEYVDKLVAENPKLVAVRGYYHCPIWGKQAHWWCKDEEGNIIDPTVKQFPTKGVCASYEEYNGMVECAECGKVLREEEARFESNYAFCSYRCHGKFVGVF